MVDIPIENIHAAQTLYLSRLDALRPEVERIAARGRSLGPKHEKETMAALTVLDNELDGLQEGLAILSHLLLVSGHK